MSDDDLARRLGPFTRRRFLIGTLGIGVAAAAGLRACWPRVDLSVPTGITALTGFECGLFEKLIPIFLPAQGTALVPPAEVPILRNIDEIFAAIDPKLRDDLGMGLKLFDYGSVALGWNFTRFINLDEREATAYCARWESGGDVQRAIFSALKQFLYVSYWRDPRTWKPVEYDGPVSARSALPRLGNTPFPEAR